MEDQLLPGLEKGEKLCLVLKGDLFSGLKASRCLHLADLFWHSTLHNHASLLIAIYLMTSFLVPTMKDHIGSSSQVL